MVSLSVTTVGGEVGGHVCGRNGRWRRGRGHGGGVSCRGGGPRAVEEEEEEDDDNDNDDEDNNATAVDECPEETEVMWRT